MGSTWAETTISRNLVRQAVRLASCVRWRSLMSRISPLAVRRRPASLANRLWAVSDKPWIERALTRSSVLVLTLLTFCPPGPLDREKAKRSSDRSVQIPGASRTPGRLFSLVNITQFYHKMRKLHGLVALSGAPLRRHLRFEGRVRPWAKLSRCVIIRWCVRRWIGRRAGDSAAGVLAGSWRCAA